MKIGEKIKLKKLDYSVDSEFREKVDDGVCYVTEMDDFETLFTIVSIDKNCHGRIYKIINSNGRSFWVEEWQIKALKKTKLEI